MNDQPVPDHNERLERMALCCLFNEPACFKALSDLGLTAGHFQIDRHRRILAGIRECYDEGLYASGMLSPYLLAHRLREAGTLADVGEAYLLEDVFDAIPAASTISALVRQLEELRERRRVKTGIEQAMDLVRSGDADEALAHLSKLAITPRGREVLKSAALQVEALVQQLVDESKTGGGSGFSTGFPKLDKITGGFVAGRTYVLGGLTSVGKTALALQFAVEVAKQGRRVYVWSKEMHHSDCRRRLAALIAEVPLPPGALKRLTDEQQDRLDGALKFLRDLPIDIDDRASSLPEMVNQARALRGEIGLFIVDHARLVRVPGAQNEYAAISEVSGACKSIFANECEAACLLLSQFSREAARDGNPKPHQLRGSGALEEDANVGMTITRAAYMKRDTKDPSATLTVWKNRDGASGRVPLEWDRKLARYIEPQTTETRGGEDE